MIELWIGYSLACAAAIATLALGGYYAVQIGRRALANERARRAYRQGQVSSVLDANPYCTVVCGEDGCFGAVEWFCLRHEQAYCRAHVIEHDQGRECFYIPASRAGRTPEQRAYLKRVLREARTQ